VQQETTPSAALEAALPVLAPMSAQQRAAAEAAINGLRQANAAAT
jgi:hypothetical protein